MPSDQDQQMKLTSLTLMLLISALSFSQTLIAQQETFNYPGGVLELFISKQSDELPDVKFGLQEPVIMEQARRWRILVGLSLDTLPGDYVMYIKHGIKGTAGMHEKIVVKQKGYPFVELADDADQWSVRQTHTSFSDIGFSNTQQPSLPLQLPLQGNWSDNFGHKLYSLSDKKLHEPNAISLATTQIASVVAPQNAIVTRIELDETGLATLFLDHGRGLYSIISGLSDLTVDVGNGIIAGAVIGKLTGDIGNSSDKQDGTIAKRLVWQTVMNGVYINPLILTQLKP